MINGSLMKVKSIAECSKGSILQYFWPALSNNWSWKPSFRLFESSRFTQVLLYIVFPFIDSLFGNFFKMINCPNELILYAKGVLIQGQILCVKVEFIQGMIV